MYWLYIDYILIGFVIGLIVYSKTVITGNILVSLG